MNPREVAHREIASALVARGTGAKSRQPSHFPVPHFRSFIDSPVPPRLRRRTLRLPWSDSGPLREAPVSGHDRLAAISQFTACLRGRIQAPQLPKGRRGTQRYARSGKPTGQQARGSNRDLAARAPRTRIGIDSGRSSWTRRIDPAVSPDCGHSRTHAGNDRRRRRTTDRLHYPVLRCVVARPQTGRVQGQESARRRTYRSHTTIGPGRSRRSRRRNTVRRQGSRKPCCLPIVRRGTVCVLQPVGCPRAPQNHSFGRSRERSIAPMGFVPICMGDEHHKMERLEVLAHRTRGRPYPAGRRSPIHRLQSRASRGHCRPRFRHWKYSNSERRSRRRTTGQSVLHRRSNRHRLRSRYDRNVIVSTGDQHLCQLDPRRSRGQLDSRPRHVRRHTHMNRWTASFKSNHFPHHAVTFQPIIQSPARFRSL